MKQFLDSCSVLANNCDFSNAVISSRTVEELERILNSTTKDINAKSKACEAMKAITKQHPTLVLESSLVDGELANRQLPRTSSNALMATAYIYSQQEDIEFVTNSWINATVASGAFGLKIKYDRHDTDPAHTYTGYIEHHFSDDSETALFYETPQNNTLGLLTNQYAVLYDPQGKLIDKVKWNGDRYTSISYKSISNDFIGKVKPRNIQQEFAFDMLQDSSSTINVLSGNFGTGKDYLMIAHALQAIRQNKFEKLIWVRNNVEVKNTNPVGFLPDGLKDKLLPFAMPLADHLGGVSGLEMLINKGDIEVVHLGFIRGRNLTNSIIYCSECENLTKEHVQLLIGRVGEGSVLWMNGDYKQTDSDVFRDNNGLKICVDKLKGNKSFAYVKLEKVERSKTATLADLLD